MVENPTDTYEFTITVIQHADLSILNPVYPSTVESGVDFTIEYDVVNNGNEDTCYGKILDLGTSNPISGSEWQDTISAGATEHKTITVVGGITSDLSAKIEVGYVN